MTEMALANCKLVMSVLLKNYELAMFRELPVVTEITQSKYVLNP